MRTGAAVVLPPLSVRPTGITFGPQDLEFMKSLQNSSPLKEQLALKERREVGTRRPPIPEYKSSLLKFSFVNDLRTKHDDRTLWWPIALDSVYEAISSQLVEKKLWDKLRTPGALMLPEMETIVKPIIDFLQLYEDQRAKYDQMGGFPRTTLAQMYADLVQETAASSSVHPPVPPPIPSPVPSVPQSPVAPPVDTCTWARASPIIAEARASMSTNEGYPERLAMARSR